MNDIFTVAMRLYIVIFSTMLKLVMLNMASMNLTIPRLCKHEVASLRLESKSVVLERYTRPEKVNLFARSMMLLQAKAWLLPGMRSTPKGQEGKLYESKFFHRQTLICHITSCEHTTK